MLYVAWKRGLPRKFARFVLFSPVKKRSFNLLCVLNLNNSREKKSLCGIFKCNLLFHSSKEGVSCDVERRTFYDVSLT